LRLFAAAAFFFTIIFAVASVALALGFVFGGFCRTGAFGAFLAAALAIGYVTHIF
jgi:hypothetical protein